MFTFGNAFVLFVSECIGMQKMWEEQQVFPGMQGSQLRLCSLQTPFSTPLQLRYSTPASTGRRFFSFLLLWLLKLHLCLGSRFSVLGDLICLSLLFLLAVRTVCVLIAPLPAHLQP